MAGGKRPIFPERRLKQSVFYGVLPRAKIVTGNKHGRGTKQDNLKFIGLGVTMAHSGMGFFGRRLEDAIPFKQYLRKKGFSVKFRKSKNLKFPSFYFEIYAGKKRIVGKDLYDLGTRLSKDPMLARYFELFARRN